MKKTIVYGLLSSKDDMVRYIGQTTAPMRRRFSQHLRYAKHKKTAVQKWINKALLDGHKVTFTILDEDAVFNETEIRLIAEHKNNGKRLLNHTDGGGGTLGLSPSEETRIKRSDSVRRNWEGQKVRIRWSATDEQKKKISMAKKISNPSMLGKKHSEETKKKMRQWFLSEAWKKIVESRRGRKHSESTRAAMSASKKRWWDSKRNNAVA